MANVTLANLVANATLANGVLNGKLVNLVANGTLANGALNARVSRWLTYALTTLAHVTSPSWAMGNAFSCWPTWLTKWGRGSAQLYLTKKTASNAEVKLDHTPGSGKLSRPVQVNEA